MDGPYSKKEIGCRLSVKMSRLLEMNFKYFDDFDKIIHSEPPAARSNNELFPP